MTTIHDTTEAVIMPREEMNVPQTDLETIFGKLSLVIYNGRSASLATNGTSLLTINKVEYRMHCQFKYGTESHEPFGAPGKWYRDRGYGMNLRRTGSYTGAPYTDAAYAAVEQKIIPLVCSFLTQNVDIVLHAAKVEMNNKIREKELEILEYLEKVDDLKKELGLLKEAERVA
jgi:hypothetical protein